jgi:hypothetical protein
MKTTHPNKLIRKLTNPWSLWRGLRAFPLAIAAAGLAFAPEARAVCNDACAGTITYQGEDAGTLGSDSTAIGFNALFSNTTAGIQNTAVGSLALAGNTTGYNNTAVGQTALQFNTTAIDTTAVGVAALRQNTTGNFNTGIGLSALTSNTTGTLNTATGTSALFYNNGNANTANGANALQLNVSGKSNTGMGNSALFNTTGSNNVGIGDSAGINLTTGNNNIDISNSGTAAETGTIRVGVQGTQTATYIAGIFMAPVPGNAVAVRINNQGKLGTIASSARFKEAIKPMDKTSESILALEPVTFRYKKDIDPEKVPQFGLVAEQVAKVNPDLVIPDEQGRPYTVRYDAVDAMLLNEFLKEHRKVEAQEQKIAAQGSASKEQAATISVLKTQIQSLTASLKEQAAQIQKVSTQLAVDRPAPRVVSAEK